MLYAYDMSEYQRATGRTAIYKQTVLPPRYLDYAVLKLVGEAGEIAQKLGKWMRDEDWAGDLYTLTRDQKRQLAEELGDVLWYVAQIADLIDYNLNAIAAMNLMKLKKRAEEGKLQGSGDHR